MTAGPMKAGIGVWGRRHLVTHHAQKHQRIAVDSLIITWLVRYGHVLGGGVWVGGYALLALVIIPRMAKHAHHTLVPVALTTIRVLTYAGTATMVLGLVLMTRRRGFAAISRGGEWGGIMLVGIAIAVALLGIGDGGLRPALRQLADTGDSRRARRLAWLGLLLTILAMGFMTRALYAGS
jgi:hypothetical protein